MPFSGAKGILPAIAIGLFLSSPTVTAQTTGAEKSQDVEIGPGGHVKPEKPYRTKLEEEFEWHAHLLWESRYVSEGRDNLSGKGIYSASTEFNYKNINIVPWIADGIHSDYSEFNLNIVYGAKLLDQLELFVGYSHIRSRESESNAHDNEISLDLAYAVNKNFQILTNVYYSFDAEGAFSQVAINKDYRFDDTFSITLCALLGFNADYVVDGHNGINHGQLLARASYLVNKEIELYAYSGYNLAIHRDRRRYAGDELLRDFFWGGIGMSYRFN